jgi:hypothetical protein
MGKPASRVDYRWIDVAGTIRARYKEMKRDERQARLREMEEYMRAGPPHLQPTQAWYDAVRELVASVDDEELMEQRGHGAMRETRALLARFARG